MTAPPLPGKPQWAPLLGHLVDLHHRSTYPARPPLPHDWESLGAGYQGGPAFGHWDIAHAVIDLAPREPEHARRQLLNLFAVRQDDGMLPAMVWMPARGPATKPDTTHPPVWPAAVEACLARRDDLELRSRALDVLLGQLRWFDARRRSPDGGYYYSDMLVNSYESGVDDTPRFSPRFDHPQACVDATAHVCMMLESALRWAPALDREGEVRALPERRAALRRLLSQRMWDEAAGWFYDAAVMAEPARRRMTFEGIWPLAAGAATPAQAERVVEALLDPGRFATPHPIATVARSDAAFELRMWRGPAWNSMTFWAARAALRYGKTAAAGSLLEAALDATARQFERTGRIWEFYHPLAGRQEVLMRKPGSHREIPCIDYVGHNPLLAMARLFDRCR